MWPVNASNGLIWLVIIIVVALLIWWLWPRDKGGSSAQSALKTLGDAAKDQAEGGAARTGQAASASSQATPDVVAATGRSAALAETSMAPTGGAAMLAIDIPTAQGEPDDLRQIKGVGPKLNSLLSDLGITRFDQIAAWSEAEIAKVDVHLGTFRGRVARDNWVEQAGLLARGDIAGFEAKFGKLGGATKS